MGFTASTSTSAARPKRWSAAAAAAASLAKTTASPSLVAAVQAGAPDCGERQDRLGLRTVRHRRLGRLLARLDLAALTIHARTVRNN